jgi:hypothetical protein
MMPREASLPPTNIIATSLDDALLACHVPSVDGYEP